MHQFVTEILAIDNVTGILTKYAGPHVVAVNWEMAENWCKSNAGWLHIVGKLELEIDIPELVNPQLN